MEADALRIYRRAQEMTGRRFGRRGPRLGRVRAAIASATTQPNKVHPRNRLMTKTEP
jgi:hypothetical protein